LWLHNAFKSFKNLIKKSRNNKHSSSFRPKMDIWLRFSPTSLFSLARTTVHHFRPSRNF
jgi:hypothetical protein